MPSRESAAKQQRKQATVLFMDIVAHTDMVRDLDPEDNMELVDKALVRLADPVERFGGHIARYQGDGFKAVFGLPVARENDPHNAVRAGLAILEEAEVIAEELQAERGLAGFQVRVGLDSGLVFSGGQTEGEDTIKGLPVNLAARLEAAAEPGSLLISQHSYQLVRGVFDLLALEALAVKGFAEPVGVYRVLAEKARSFRMRRRGVEGIETRMVGREDELKTLEEAYAAVLTEGRLRAVTVLGEAGVGKSRLVDEFENWVDLQPESLRLYRGRAYLETRRLPYAMLRSLFAFRFEIQDDDSRDAAREKFVEGFEEVLGAAKEGEHQAQVLGQLLGYDFDPGGRHEDGQQLRERALAYLRDYFQAVSANNPVLILLEDLHWADASSLDALEELLEALNEEAILIVSAARAELYERRPDWLEGHDFHRPLKLAPLNAAGSQQLLAEVLQRVAEVPSALKELIATNAEGNPFYVEELVKVLVETGVIVKGEQQWRVEAERLKEVTLPATLTGVLQARLDRLPGDEKTVLQQASVVGRVFWDRALSYFNQDGEAGLEEEVIAGALSQLRDRELVHRRELPAFLEAREYLFKHAMLREVTYESVLKKLRRLYHGLAAEWLSEQSSARTGEVDGLLAAQIGWHYSEAGDAEQAVPYLLQAGDNAFKLYAFREAIDAYEGALKFLKQSEDHERTARTLMQLGSTYHLAFEYRAANEAFKEAFGYWQQAAMQPSEEELPLAPHALRMNWGPPRGLDPLSNGGDGAGFVVVSHLFSGLMELRSVDEGVIPDMAKSWEISEDGRQYAINLYEDFTWSDGVPVNSHDYVYYLEKRNE